MSSQAWGPEPVPPRPDVPFLPPAHEPPARWSIPAGAIVLVAAGAVAVASAVLPWWSASVTLSFSNGGGGHRALGNLVGAASWSGRATALVGLVAFLSGLVSLGTQRAKTRRALALAGLACGLALAGIGVWSFSAGDHLVAARADRSVQAQDLGMSDQLSGFAAEVGAEAGLTGARVDFRGEPAPGIWVATAAAFVAIAGGLLLLRSTSGDRDANAPWVGP